MNDQQSTTDDFINLDANANAQVTSPVLEAIVTSMGAQVGNPSSDHLRGFHGRRIVAMAKSALVSMVSGAFEEGVILTSGGTEANNLALSAASPDGSWLLVTTAVEHASVLRPAERFARLGGALEILPVDGDGRVDLERLRQVLDTPRRVLVSIQAANSETGVVQPLESIAEIVSVHGSAIFHSDCAQAIGRMPLPLGGPLGPDMISVSGHKFHGPMGIGALVLADDVDPPAPLLLGGSQEGGARAGTEAVPLVAGMGKAAEIRATRMEEHRATMQAMRDRLEGAVVDRVADARVVGIASSRLVNTSNILFRGVDAAALIAAVSDRIAISQGSACSSRRPVPSHVLRAMGLSEADAYSCIRFSVSHLNSSEEMDRAADVVSGAVKRLRAIGAAA